MKTRLDELREQCRKYHKEHPEVWDMFCAFTMNRIERGFKHYSAHAIFQQIRWHTGIVDVNGKDAFKINHNYFPLYARRFMKMYPQYDGFFRTRHLPTSDKPATWMPDMRPSDFGEYHA